MNPCTTAALSAGAMKLFEKVTEGAMGKLGEAAYERAKSYWGKLRAALGWSADPAVTDLKAALNKALEERPAARETVQSILNEYEQVSGQAMVESIHVEKGTANVVGTNTGSINNTNTFN